MARRDWRQSLDKRMRKLVKDVEAQGWTVTLTANSHMKFKPPSGPGVTGSGLHDNMESHYARTVKRLRDRGCDV